MRILFLSQGKTFEDQIGYHDAFLRLVSEGVLERYDNVPYKGYVAEHGWASLFDEICSRCHDNQYDVVLFQNYHHTDNPDPTVCIARIRSQDKPPLIFVSNGDGWSCGIWGRQVPKSFIACARAADMTFSTSMGAFADFLISQGVRNVMLLPHALCESRFDAAHGIRNNGRNDFDVVMVGNMSRRTRVFGRAERLLSPRTFSLYQRLQTARVLQKRYGKRFGLFGINWNGFSSWQGVIPFAEQQTVFRQSRVVVDSCPPIISDYYLSDRPFFAAGTGEPVVMFPVPRVDRLLRVGEQIFFAETPSKTCEVCDSLLALDDRVMRERRNYLSEWIRDAHTVYRRVRLMLDTADILRNSKNLGTCMKQIPLPYFLPEVDVEKERVYALRGWRT